jgi:hypothetical protein
MLSTHTGIRYISDLVLRFGLVKKNEKKKTEMVDRSGSSDKTGPAEDQHCI